MQYNIYADTIQLELYYNYVEMDLDEFDAFAVTVKYPEMISTYMNKIN